MTALGTCRRPRSRKIPTLRSNHQFQLALVEKLNDIQEELVRLLPDAEATALSPINTEKFAGEIVNLDAATSY